MTKEQIERIEQEVSEIAEASKENTFEQTRDHYKMLINSLTSLEEIGYACNAIGEKHYQ